MTPELRERAARVRLLLMDVDGVLTNGQLINIAFPTGEVFETKAFDSQDGIALQWLKWNDVTTGVISGRVSPSTEARAKQVGMRYVFQGHIEKLPILDQIMRDSGIPLEEMAFMGDDLTDVVVMRRVGLALAPASARPEVKRVAHYVSPAAGGLGAVRDVCELILKAQDRWPSILEKYELL